MNATARGPGFWRVVILLMGVARRRSGARMARYLRLTQNRGGIGMTSWAGLGFVLALLMGGFLHFAMAMELEVLVQAASTAEGEAGGANILPDDLVAHLRAIDPMGDIQRAAQTMAGESEIARSPSKEARTAGGSEEEAVWRLRQRLRAEPSEQIMESDVWRGDRRLADAFALVVLLIWAATLTCQGEGPDFDTQRSRHPMWEWLFSHPVAPGAVFLAEMLSPIAANPFYLTAPIFPATLLNSVYGAPGFVVGATLVGIPVSVALACLGKAIEIRALLALPPRRRGALLGLMRWFGTAAPILNVMALSNVTDVPRFIARLLPLAAWPWPRVRALAGLGEDGSLELWRAVALCALLSCALIAASVVFSARSARLGLAGRFSAAPQAPDHAARFGGDPLWRKEWLWLRRDGGALVQAVLLPLSFAAFQTFNIRNALRSEPQGWNLYCGVAIVFGVYFIMSLGPKSLASEGRALWLALTWPRGLERLLKAKARMWASLANAIVGVALVATALAQPGDAFRILAVAGLWIIFSRALSEKMVALATPVSESGEAGKPSQAMRWAATVGTFSFAAGVISQQWNFAIAGVVYGVISVAAVWQGFRQRLPFLFDPWSETLPPPPTLMHALVTIGLMNESMAILSALALRLLGSADAWPAIALLYGVCALGACFCVSVFLIERGVAFADVWRWRGGQTSSWASKASWLAVGALAGAALGAAAHAYLAGVELFPAGARAIEAGRAQFAGIPQLRKSYFAMAVLMAPFAEEYLFRGLLYRALDREWGGLRAIAGAAAFFAVYHPMSSWAPVAALGAANAWMFKRSGALVAPIAAHITYNFVVLAF